MLKFIWTYPRNIFARELKLKLRSNSNASSIFGDYEIPAREYAEYNKSGIFTLGLNFRLRSFTLRAHRAQTVQNPVLEHDRACEIIERQIDYETEYAEYELSKDWETSKTRSNLLKMLGFFFVILILSGRQSILYLTVLISRFHDPCVRL